MPYPYSDATLPAALQPFVSSVHDGHMIGVADAYSYENEVTLIQCSVLGFCGCGAPWHNLSYLRERLAFLDWQQKLGLGDNWDDTYALLCRRERELFGGDSGAGFFYYWCDSKGLVEHGSSLPGWLSTEGRVLLKALDYLAETGQIAPHTDSPEQARVKHGLAAVLEAIDDQ